MNVVSPEDVQRVLLTHKADRWFICLVVSTIVLFIGAIGEYVKPLDRLPTHNVNTRTRVRTPRKWVIRFQIIWHVFAIVFVVGGIGAEGIFEYLAARAEDKVRDFDNDVAIRAGEAAHDAEQFSIIAQNAAGRAQIKADAVDQRAGALDDRLNTATGKLTNLEIAVAPRWQLLEKEKREFIQSLTKYSGEKVILVECGSSTTEAYKLREDLFNFLGIHGAGLNVSETDWPTCPPSGSFGMNGLEVSTEASKKVREEAWALHDALNKLKISTTTPLEAGPNEASPQSLSSVFFGPGNPVGLAAKNSTSVVLLISPHP